LIKPLAMHYAPHSLEIANSNTGKTRFYDSAGIKIDKATRRAALGFAKSPTEVYPGTINGTELPTAFDQIESQDSYELAKYMLDILETGRALVDAGGVRFVVETKSSFAYLGNPVAKDAKVVEGFKALLNHICSNPAMGRRFGIILFATDLKTIRGKSKMSIRELEEWKRRFTLFRAVEEYADSKLKQIIRDPKITEWLHQPIKGYRETIYSATQELDDYNLAAFFEAHAEAEHRVRGAALHAAIALLLDKIALDKITIEEILKEAEDHLSDYVDINLQSIVHLCSMWDRLRTDQAKAYFENLSDYMKEIVSACIHYKNHNPEAVSVDLQKIPYEPENKQAYSYFSKCIDLLKRRKKISSLNETLKNFYGFQLVKKDNGFVVEYLENPKPPKDLPIIGNFVISSISSFRSSQREASFGEKEQKQSDLTSSMTDEAENNLSKKTTKSRNSRNYEKRPVRSEDEGSGEKIAPSKVAKLPKILKPEKEDILRVLGSAPSQMVKREDLVESLVAENFDEAAINELISQMIRDGDLYEPRPPYVAPILEESKEKVQGRGCYDCLNFTPKKEAGYVVGYCSYLKANLMDATIRNVIKQGCDGFKMKTPEDASKKKRIGLTAESCEFYHTSKCKAGVPSAVLPNNPCPETCERFKPKWEGAFNA